MRKARSSRKRKKYGGLEVSESRRLKQLEEESRTLKRVVAELGLRVRVSYSWRN